MDTLHLVVFGALSLLVLSSWAWGVYRRRPIPPGASPFWRFSVHPLISLLFDRVQLPKSRERTLEDLRTMVEPTGYVSILPLLVHTLPIHGPCSGPLVSVSGKIGRPVVVINTAQAAQDLLEKT